MSCNKFITDGTAERDDKQCVAVTQRTMGMNNLGDGNRRKTKDNQQEMRLKLLEKERKKS